MQRCPLCRARLAGEALCPRCGADLAQAQAAEAEAVRRLRQALAALATDDRRAAAARAREAVRLHRTPLNAAVARWLAESVGAGDARVAAARDL